MPDLILQIWKLVLLGFVYLFLLRVIRAIWANLRTTTTPVKPADPPPPPQRAPKEIRATLRFKVLEPKELSGRTYDLGDEITIGRAPGCKISIDDTYVSQLHARIFRRDDQVMIEDLGSTNGTFCNGKAVSGPVPLRKGDRVQVGRTVMEAVR
jgi:pSer/pThr/pTyr-binding forkhead associated (FHA) protein